MLQLEEANGLLADMIYPIHETEMVSLMDGIGRVLAKDACARFDQPPFPRSPLDGYAVKGMDTLGHPANSRKSFV
jgi:molybdopterin molybdotransferase